MDSQIGWKMAKPGGYQNMISMSLEQWKAHRRDANRVLIISCAASACTAFLAGFAVCAIVGWLL